MVAKSPHRVVSWDTFFPGGRWLNTFSASVSGNINNDDDKNNYSHLETRLLEFELAGVPVIWVNCKIQFSVLKIDSSWVFSTSVYCATEVKV